MTNNKQIDIDGVIKNAAVWAAKEYERRTRLIADGCKSIQVEGKERATNVLYFLHPQTRVGWHEVCAKFDLKVMHPEHYKKWHPLWTREMKKRNLHLIKKANGLKADEWVKRFPNPTKEVK